MNKLIIYEYISKIKPDDIINFGLKQGINLQSYEVSILYNYLKNDYKRILNYPEDVLEEIRYQVNNLTYQKILELYHKYKDKIN